jgi:hypothetical protein
VKKLRKIEGGDDAPTTSNWRLPAGEKTFHMRRQNRVVAQMPRYTGGLITDFK